MIAIGKVCGRYLIFLLLFSGVWAPCGMLAANEQVVQLNRETNQYNLGPFSQYNRALNADKNWLQMQAMAASEWHYLDQEIPSLGFDTSTHWFRVPLHNVELFPLVMLLEVAYPVLDKVTIYLLGPDESLLHKFELGDQQPFSSRPILHRNFVVPLKIPANSRTTILVRVETESAVQVPLILWQENAFYESQQSFLVGQGLYFGAVLVMSIYNLFIFISVRHRAYVFYAVSVLGVAGFLASINGLGFQYLWGPLPQINQWITPFCLAIFVGASASFLDSLLFLERNSPVSHRVMKSVCYVCLVLILAQLFIPYQYIIQIDVLVGMLAAVCAMIIGVYLLVKGVRTARYYVMASCCLWVGGIVLSLSKFGVLPRNVFTENIIQITSAIEFVLLSFALGDRINQERRQKFQAQKLALTNEKLARAEQERYMQLEHKAQLEELEAKQQLIESRAESRAKSEFLAIMSHEIRTPMNGLLGMAQLLKDAQLSAEHRRFLDVLLSSGKSLLNIIDDILDYSKVTMGKLELESIDTNIRAVCAECINIFTVLADRENIELSCNVDNNVPGLVVCDPTRLRQVLLNLLGNAFKFTQQGSVELWVTRIEEDDTAGLAENLVLKFEIRDTGIGIDPSVVRKLFQPFTQAESSISRQFGGTGLGLSISRNLVQLMGGDIKVESTLGKGSIFWFTIRCQRRDSAQLPSEQDQAQCSVAQLQQQLMDELGNMDKSILVVEDNSVNQLVVGSMLSKIGLAYQVAENGQQALEKIKTDHDRLFMVLMDCEMPILDGYSTTKAIRTFERENHLSELPVVALTAHVLKEHQAMAQQAGMNGSLAKPLSFDNLIVTLKEFC